MKKNLGLAVSCLLITALFFSCANAAGSNGDGTNPDSNKTNTGSNETQITIVAETFAGQVYYLDELESIGNRSADRAASSAAEASKGIDTTRDRIVFAETGNDYTLYIGDKSYEGTYEVDLENREISLTGKDSENTAVELSGTLSFSADAKSVEFEGIAKDESGTETKIEKKGQIKWDWSELGEWKQEAYDFKLHYSNLSIDFDETGYVQLWRGQVDFTNAAYTRGIKIPATCFSNVKAGDCIAFLRKEGPRALFLKNDGPKLKYRNYSYDIYNYEYETRYLSQENLDYIKNNQGLDIYGDNSVLEGIIIGSESSIDVAVKKFCSRDYTVRKWSEEWTFNFHYYVDNVHNNYTIEFDFTKNGETDNHGLDLLSTDKNIYRRYMGRGCVSDLAESIDVEESTFVFSDETYDSKFIKFWRVHNNKNEFVDLKEYVEEPVKMAFDIQKNESEDTYTLKILDAPSFVTDCLSKIEEKAFTLTCHSDILYSQLEFPVDYDDLSKSGKWTVPEVDGDTILVWEGECDYSTANFEKGFYIPKEKLSGLESDDKIYIIYPKEGNRIDISNDTIDRKEKNISCLIFSSWGWIEPAEGTVCACPCTISNSDKSLEFIKENGLKIACDGNKVLKILIGKRDNVDSYFYHLTN